MRKILLLFGFLLLSSLPAKATLSLVSVSVPSGSGLGSPITYSVTSSTGSLEIIGIISDTGVTVTSCTDNKSQTYILHATHGTSTAGNAWICYKTSSATGVTSVTVSFTGTTTLNVAVYDVSSATGGAVDAIVGYSAQTGAASQSVTAAGAGFAVDMYVPNVVPTLTGAFTDSVMAQNGIAGHAYSFYDQNAAGGTLTANANSSPSVWAAVIVEFKEAAGGTNGSLIAGPTTSAGPTQIY